MEGVTNDLSRPSIVLVRVEGDGGWAAKRREVRWGGGERSAESELDRGRKRGSQSSDWLEYSCLIVRPRSAMSAHDCERCVV